MTTPATAPATPTYARARLWTGITGVGTLVVLAATLLVLEVPTRALAGLGGSLAADLPVLLALVLGLAVVTLPLDLTGGLVLPRRYGRFHRTGGAFLGAWLRGVVWLALLASACGSLVLAAGRAGGLPLALVAFLLLSGLTLLLQEPLARRVGGLRRRQSPGDTDVTGGDVLLVESADPGFTGGFTGPAAMIVLPHHWRSALEPAALEALLERRRRLRADGAWRRGVLAALAWNTLGFGLASQLPGAGVASLAELATTALGFTLWTFLGLLLLPRSSRRATLAADALLAADPDSVEPLGAAVRALDRLQDDEPERSAGLESVFHPVPAALGRLAALTDLAAGPGSTPRPGASGAWQVARTALFLSHVGLSLLPRAVHCNAGRPELWVYLPSDG
jgi:hypothetical protein